MIDLGKHRVLGVGIDAVDYSAATDRVVCAAREGRPFAVSALAVHGVMTGVLDRTHRYRLNNFDMIVPDGQPVRWALRWLHGAKLPDRVYGPNLMLEVCRAAADAGLPIFLFGGQPELLEALSQNLSDKFPNLRIAGVRPSAFRKLTPEERDQAAAEIRASGAKIVFVGLGCPRQEVFSFEMRELLGMPSLAVGAAFNFHAGLLPQAPSAMQKRGLEWLYRFIQEPRRLWRRYLLLNPLYLTLVALQFFGLKDFSRDFGEQPREDLRYG
jgi:N-acetylglucosaminyldiphosphoundecaprenol N-acetyl-beta-D-mannosaminyltransferase